MLDNLIEGVDISLLEKIQATNTELLKIKEIIKEREEKGKYAYTEHLIPFISMDKRFG